MSYDFNAGNRSLDGTFGSNQNSQGLSLVAWIKCDAASWAAISQQYIVHLKETDNSQDNSIKLTKTAAAANRITAATRDTGDGNAHYNFPATTYDSLWVVVVATFTNDSLRNSYAEASANKGNSTALKSAGALLRFLSIGRSATGFSNLAGLASHVALFNRVLADVEIDALQTGPEAGIAPNTVAPANCIGYWPLTVNQTTHPDESGNGGPTLTVNGAVFTADDPTIGAVGDTPAVNDVPMPDQVVQIGTPYSFDVRPYWSGVPSPVFFDDGLPIGLDISDAGIISGIPQGGFNPPEQPTNAMVSAVISTTFVGYSSNLSAGSLNPVTYNSRIINLFSSDSVTNSMEMRIQGSNVPNSDEAFQRLRIRGAFGDGTKSILLNRVDAQYDSALLGETGWNWIDIPALLDGNSYDIFFEGLPSTGPRVQLVGAPNPPALISTTVDNQPPAARVAYRLNANGTEEYAVGGSNGQENFITLGTWLVSGNASDYEAMYTGTDTEGPTGINTWVSLSTSGWWELITNIGIPGDGVFNDGTIAIRDAATLEVLISDVSVYQSVIDLDIFP